MKKVINLIFAVIFIAAVGFGIYMLLNPEPEGYARQETEEELAEKFLQDVMKRKDSGNVSVVTEDEKNNIGDDTQADKQDNTQVDVQIELHLSDDNSNEYADFSDDNYYSRDNVTYTPDYARGYLQCVLEIPKETVQIRRGVYSGTSEDIAYDLSIWMVTAARPDYVLGETHYVIYGHNHTEQNLSFNRLKNVEVGDEFYLTDENAEYVYEVTRVLKMTRGDVAKNLVDNFEISSDYCYIVTCGRDEMRYYDRVVEGRIKIRSYYGL